MSAVGPGALVMISERYLPRPSWVMPREIRLVILSIGLILTDAPGIMALELALGIIAVGGTLTVIQRILHVRAQAKHPPVDPQIT